MPQKALFLDRDGCVIEDAHYLKDLSAIKLIPGVGQTLKKVQDAGYALILVTNQSGVARGVFDEAFVDLAHERLRELLAAFGVRLTGVYYCPHHPSGIPPYNIDCNCRKPKTGMINQAFAELDLVREGSLMIGDKQCDVELGLNAGLQGWMVLTGHGKEEEAQVRQAHPDAKIFGSLVEAVTELVG